jgi:signal transduction histidine kinase
MKIVAPLALRSLAIALVQSLVLALAARSLPGVPAEAGIRLAVALFLAGSLAGLAIAFHAASRSGSLARVVSARPGLSDPPVSPAVVQDAFATPILGGAAMLAACTLLVAADTVGVLAISGAAPGQRVPLAFLALAIIIAGVLPTAALWRSVFSRWLARLAPGQVAAKVQSRLPERLAVNVALPAAAVVLVATSAILAAVPDLSPSAVAVLVILPLAVTAAAAWLGARLGAWLRADLRELVARIQGAGEEARLADALAEIGPMRIRGPDRVARELILLARRVEEASTREDRARTAVLDAQQLKTQFMAAMSHDLRSPLNGILGFGELLSRAGERGQLNAPQRESVNLIQRAGADLLRLIDDILDSAKLDAGRLTIRRQWTPSVEILTEAVRRGEELVKNSDLRLEAELQPGLPPVHVDAERIVQAVVGLLGHAAHAMDRGTIRLRARVATGPPGPPEQVRVDVIDSGQGIRAADRERIFEAFREIAEPSGRRIGGLGLGLALARALVRAHGGDVWFETRPGEGTTFTVALPVGEG